MMKKIVKYSGIAFALLSLLSLSLPVFSTRITDGEACDLVVKGYNLVEFSPLGGIVLLTPLVLLGLMLADFIFGRDGGIQEELDFLVRWAKSVS